MLTYLLINLSVVFIPFLFSFDRKVAFYSRWKFVLPAIILGTIPFIAWDIWFAHEGYWGFTDSYILGTRFLGLPLEEWLFFSCYTLCRNILLRRNELLFSERLFRFGAL